jgi:hypothetical protein
MKKQDFTKEIMHDHQEPDGIRFRWFRQKPPFLLNIRQQTLLIIAYK